MSEIIRKTVSVCPNCLKRINAEIVLRDDSNIYMQKRCSDCGEFEALVWEGDKESYLDWGAPLNSRSFTAPDMPKRVDKGCPYDCGLCAAHKNSGCCVLLELTKRCNLRCPVCFASAAEGECEKDPSLREIETWFFMLSSYGRPFNIQLSGGEPSLREDLPEIMDLGRRYGFSFFQLNTNGLRLAEEPEFAEELKKAGLGCVFLQFDSLTDEPYTALRGRPLLSHKLKAIENAEKAGLPVVLVPTLVDGLNLHELGDIIKFGLERSPHIRGVHLQPMSEMGRFEFRNKKRISIPKLINSIAEGTGGLMKYEDFTGGSSEHPYCSIHAAYMIKPDGSLKALEPSSGCGCSCDNSRDFVATRWGKSNDSFEKHADGFDEFLDKAVLNTFTVSSMLFQDAWNLDLERLKYCYLMEFDPKRGLVPFCAYNLTNSKGEALYRK